MTDALKELLGAYKHLPVGVVFFKERELFFVNDHLRHTLLLGDLPGSDILGIIAGMLGIENASHESLYDYLSQNDFFWYHDRLIQIERQEYDTIAMFVLIRVKDAVIQAIDSTQGLRQSLGEEPEHVSLQGAAASEIEALLQRNIGNYKNVQIPSVVLYKGIPIKGSAAVVGIRDGSIMLKVERKQLAAVQPGVRWLFGFKGHSMLMGTVSHYDLSRDIIVLEDIRSVSKSFHMRNMIRYEANSGDQLSMTLEGKQYRFQIYDVSEKGVSVIVTQPEGVVALEQLGGKSFRASIMLDGQTSTAYLHMIYKAPATGEEKGMKFAFSCEYDAPNATSIHEWLNSRQLRLIKEVRSFVQMLPVSKKTEE